MNWKSNRNTWILINSRGLNSREKLKISGYIIYKVNYTESLADRSPIANEYDIQHKLLKDFHTDVFAPEIQINLGAIIIAVIYLPLRRPYLSFTVIYRRLNNSITTYIIEDFIGRHFGNKNNNTAGKKCNKFSKSRQNSAFGTTLFNIFTYKLCYNSWQFFATSSII